MMVRMTIEKLDEALTRASTSMATAKDSAFTPKALRGKYLTPATHGRIIAITKVIGT